LVRQSIHLFLHFAVPALFAAAFYRERFLRAWLIMVATMVVDLDHLLADPVFDPNRCSIGFHPLHSWPAIGVYALATIPRPTRLVAAGLLIHMFVDGTDCLWMALADRP
jgi:hypothetical protein